MKRVIKTGGEIAWLLHLVHTDICQAAVFRDPYDKKNYKKYFVTECGQQCAEDDDDCRKDSSDESTCTTPAEDKGMTVIMDLPMAQCLLE